MTSTLMNELFTGYCYNGLGLQMADITLKAYVLHMGYIIDTQCKILDAKGTHTGNTWVDDICDIMEGEMIHSKLHIDQEGRNTLMEKKLNINDIICELLNRKYQLEYDDSKSHFEVMLNHGIVLNTDSESESESD